MSTTHQALKLATLTGTMLYALNFAVACTCESKRKEPDRIEPEFLSDIKPGSTLPKAQTDITELQSYAPAGVTVPILDGKPYAFDGIVLSVDGSNRLLSVRGTEAGFNPQTKRVYVHPEAYIEADGKPTSLIDFRAGDRLFTQGYIIDGNYQAVEVLSEIRNTRGMLTNHQRKADYEKKRQAHLEAQESGEQAEGTRGAGFGIETPQDRAGAQ